MFQVISECYERRSLIITSNLEFSGWNTVLGNNRLTAALIDRLVHYSHIVIFSGESYRLQQSMKRQKTARKKWAKYLNLQKGLQKYTTGARKRALKIHNRGAPSMRKPSPHTLILCWPGYALFRAHFMHFLLDKHSGQFLRIFYSALAWRLNLMIS